jgi:hypothetical protein
VERLDGDKRARVLPRALVVFGNAGSIEVEFLAPPVDSRGIPITLAS